jgi:hypothetical protein
MLIEIKIEDSRGEFDNYITELGEVNDLGTVAILNDYLVFYALTKADLFNVPKPSKPLLAFIFNDRYSLSIFQGIMPNSGAVGVLTARRP